MTNIRITNIFQTYQRADMYRMAVMALAYPLLHILSLKISTYNNVGDLIWLPSGIALGFLLLYGLRLWPSIYFGALTGSLISHDPWPAVFIIALSNALGPLAGAYLLTRVTHFDISLKHARDVGLLVFCGGLIGGLISASIGAPNFVQGNMHSSTFLHLFLDWWMSDFISVVILTPLMLLTLSLPLKSCMALQRRTEALVLIVGASAITIITHNLLSPSDRILLLIPFFIWSAARMGQRGTALTTFIIYSISILMVHDDRSISSADLHFGWDIWLSGVVMTLSSQFIAVLFNQRDKIEQKLRNSEEHHRLSQLYGGIGAWESNLITNEQIWSENCYQIMSFPVAEKPTWEKFLKTIIPEDQHRVIDATKAHLKEGAPYDVSYRIFGTNGSIRWIRSAGQAERTSFGAPIRMRGIVQDITEQALLYTSLGDSEKRYKALMDKARDAIVVTDLNGNLEQVNQAGETLLGYTQDEIRKLNIMDVHPTSESPKIRQHFDSVTKGHITPLETKIITKHGQVIDIEVRPSLVEIHGVMHPHGIYIDLTERKQAENQRLLQEKTQREALIREVHHRIKNNLQGITGVLRTFAENYPQTAQPLNEAISQVQSIAAIHGIKTNLGSSPINLCAIIKPIAYNTQLVWKTPIVYCTPACKTARVQI